MKKASDNEFCYQLTMSLVRRMKQSGIITDGEYKYIDTIMLGKYRPVIGTLLSENARGHKNE